MSILDQILNRPGKAPIPVPTPEWPELDGRLAVRHLSAAERVALDLAMAEQNASSGAAFVAAVACGCTVLLPATAADLQVPAFAPGDWKQLVDDPGSGAAIDRLFEAADEANCLSAAARGRLKKASASATDSGSTCASPASSA